jgi:phage terminase large subunit-like protein
VSWNRKLKLQEKFDLVSQRYDSSQHLFTDESAYERIKCEESLYDFFKGCWSSIQGDTEFIDGWHMQSVCEHLEEAYKGNIKYLVINLPPRSSKSLLVSVAFPAWVWTKNQYKQFICSSYARDLSKSLSADCLSLIQSAWYQGLWGHKVQISKSSKSKLRFDNTAGGFRISSSINSGITGFGGHFLIVDDPNNPSKVDSDAVRKSTITSFDRGMSNRFKNPKDFCIIVVQQRTHEEDITGHLLDKKYPNLVHLCLPMEFEKDRVCVTVPTKSTNGKAWKDPRSVEGESIWPAYWTPDLIAKEKIKLGSDYARSGQLQQRPSPNEGSILQKGWFKPWKEDEPPDCAFVLQSWDTALSEEPGACYSACTTWGIFPETPSKYSIILLAIWYGQVEYPLLRKIAQKFGRNYMDLDTEDFSRTGGASCPPDVIIIEDKSSGAPLVQDLLQAGLQVVKYDPRKDGDKLARARIISPLLETGKVYLPTRPKKTEYGNHATERVYTKQASELIDACVKFPYGRQAQTDIVDSMSQAFIRIKQDGWVVNSTDPELEMLHNMYRRPTKMISPHYPLM